ncbi:MAG: TraB/GumN family protein [Gammaproteobacteria bacterium]
MKRLLAVALLWILTGPCRALECQPLVPAATGAAFTAGKYAQGLLFRISKAGVAPSHVFGTIHLGDRRVLDLPRVVLTSFEQSRRFVMEAVLDEAGIAEFSNLMFYSDATSLRDRVGAELAGAAEPLLAGYGITAEIAHRIKPWAAYMTLSVPPPSRLLPLDLALMQRAKARGIAISGLESLAEQAAALGDLRLEDQIALLKDAVCHYELLQQDLEPLTALYLERDLAGLMALAGKYQTRSAQYYERFLDSLLWKRNRRMAARMQPWLKEGDTFVAVGALHLAGEKGVPALLEQAGYRVTRLY